MKKQNVIELSNNSNSTDAFESEFDLEEFLKKLSSRTGHNFRNHFKGSGSMSAADLKRLMFQSLLESVDDGAWKATIQSEIDDLMAFDADFKAMDGGDPE